MTQVSTLRPGLLVSLKTTLKGNARYSTQDIELDHVDETGARVARWETLRTIADPAEHADGVKARSDARNAITRVCVNSEWLLCPQSRRADLDEAIRTARSIVNGFNSRARQTEVTLSVVIGEIAENDLEAVKAINSEIRDLLADMERGVANCEPKTIRDAANKARALGQMLTPEANARIATAIETARKAARRIVEAGETAAQEVDRNTLATLASARTAFLDLDEENTERTEIDLPSTETARAIDFEPAEAVKLNLAPPAVLRFDF